MTRSIHTVRMARFSTTLMDGRKERKKAMHPKAMAKRMECSSIYQRVDEWDHQGRSNVQTKKKKGCTVEKKEKTKAKRKACDPTPWKEEEKPMHTIGRFNATYEGKREDGKWIQNTTTRTAIRDQCTIDKETSIKKSCFDMCKEK